MHVLRVEATRRIPRLRRHRGCPEDSGYSQVARPARLSQGEDLFPHSGGPSGVSYSGLPGRQGSRKARGPPPDPHARVRVLVSVSGSVALSLPPMTLCLNRFAQQVPPAGPAPTRRPRFAPARDEDSSFRYDACAPERQPRFAQASWGRGFLGIPGRGSRDSSSRGLRRTVVCPLLQTRPVRKLVSFILSLYMYLGLHSTTCT